jgi:hypothetical protein
MSSGDSRQYVINLPVPYDMNKPYRFIYASHGSGGEGSDIVVRGGKTGRSNRHQSTSDHAE